MKRFNKAIAATVAGAITTGIAAFFPELGPEEIGAIGTLLGLVLTYFAPANQEI